MSFLAPRAIRSTFINLAFILLFFQNAIKDCMNEIEVSIGKSLSGSSFQPQQQQQPQPHHQEQPQQQKVPTPSQVAAVSAPKTVIYNSAPSSNSSSTTPTDVMDVTAAYVY